MDILFNLQKQNDQIELEPATLRRKTQAEKTLVQCALRIDGVEVAKTNGVKLNWPSFECDILDQFQIHVFTLPTDIELDIIIGGTHVDRILLDVPGNHVKSLTSASRLIKEYDFSRRSMYIKDMLQRGNPDLGKDPDLMDENEKKYYEKHNPQIKKMELDGTLFVKAEWEGFGEYMPPARSETIMTKA